MNAHYKEGNGSPFFTISCFKLLILSEKLSLRAELFSPLSPKSELQQSPQSAASFIHTRRLSGVFLPTLFSSSFRSGSESLRISSAISQISLLLPGRYDLMYRSWCVKLPHLYQLPLWAIGPPSQARKLRIHKFPIRVDNNTTKSPRYIHELSTINHDREWQTCHKSAEQARENAGNRNEQTIYSAVTIHSTEVLLVCSPEHDAGKWKCSLCSP